MELWSGLLLGWLTIRIRSRYIAFQPAGRSLGHPTRPRAFQGLLDENGRLCIAQRRQPPPIPARQASAFLRHALRDFADFAVKKFPPFDKAQSTTRLAADKEFRRNSKSPRESLFGNRRGTCTFDQFDNIAARL